MRSEREARVRCDVSGENYAGVHGFFSRVRCKRTEVNAVAVAAVAAAAVATVHGSAEHAPRNCVSRGRRPEISSVLLAYIRENDGTRTVGKE